MIYIAIQLALLFACFMVSDKEKRDKVYKISFILLTALLVFRYGQGSDYFNYETIFNLLGDKEQIFVFGDPGFNILTVAMRSIGIDYIGFTAIIGIVSMALVYRFFHKFCNNKLMALTIFYPVYYMVFWYSAIRQGFAMSIFVGLLLPLLANKKYIMYVIGVVITATFHLSAIFLLVLVVVKFLPLYKIKYLVGITIALGVYQVLGIQNMLLKFLPESIYERAAVYFSDDISLGALLLRTVFFAIVLYLFYKSSKEEQEENKFLFNIYVASYFLYLVLMTSPAIASRLNSYIKIVECILIANYIPIVIKSRREIVNITFVGLLLMFSLGKNIEALLYQGDYYSHVSMFKYPYITIFNKDDVFGYREVKDPRYKGILQNKYQWPVVLDDKFEKLPD